MEKTKYSTCYYMGNKYLIFEYTKTNFFGFKVKKYKFIPTKHLYNKNGEKIIKWKLSNFPDEMNEYNAKIAISGEEKHKKTFIEKYPNISMYLIELNNFLKNY